MAWTIEEAEHGWFRVLETDGSTIALVPDHVIAHQIAQVVPDAPYPFPASCGCHFDDVDMDAEWNFTCPKHGAVEV